AETTVKMATIDGAKVLGLSDVTGSIEIGKKADIIVIDTNKPHLVPMYNPYSHLVYSVNGNDVAATVINGKVVMENGNIFTMDVEKAMDDVKSIAIEIKANDLKN
ncbi:MAG: amidohydrolase family protein, partial [Desulfobacteraceae bacterium]|nr:amidohydrolase family protein [Desulfobacteraceae bacterium]